MGMPRRLMSLNISQTELKVIGLAKSSLTHGGMAEEHKFSPAPISGRKSLSCVTSEIRAWSETSEKAWVVSGVQQVTREAQPPIRSARSRGLGLNSSKME